MSQVTHTLKSTSAQCLGAKITWLWVNLRLVWRSDSDRSMLTLFQATTTEGWADIAREVGGCGGCAVRCQNLCYRWMAMPRWWSSNLGPQAFSFCTFMFESQTGVWVFSRCFKQCSSSFPATLTFRSRRGSNCHALAQPLNLCFLRLLHMKIMKSQAPQFEQLRRSPPLPSWMWWLQSSWKAHWMRLVG